MGEYTIKGPYSKGSYEYSSLSTARAALDRMDNKYGSYAHTIVKLPLKVPK